MLPTELEEYRKLGGGKKSFRISGIFFSIKAKKSADTTKNEICANK